MEKITSTSFENGYGVQTGVITIPSTRADKEVYLNYSADVKFFIVSNFHVHSTDYRVSRIILPNQARLSNGPEVG